MNVNFLPIGIGIVLVLGIGGLVLLEENEVPLVPIAEAPATPETPAARDDTQIDEEPTLSTSDAGTPAANTLPPVEPAPETPSGITLAQVATHASRTSCWSAIHGSVYDLTSWIPKHPGGEGAILSLCGIDGSEKFNRKHGSDTKPPLILAGFKIAPLAP
ncbi:MAG: cytochrome b5-like heme/steroid binding domain-containing protein [Minisyncoccia bacterium]